MPEEILAALEAKIDTLSGEVRAVRESVIRMETHGYSEQIRELRVQQLDTKKDVIVLQTQGRMYTAGVAAVVAVIVAVVTEWVTRGAPGS